METHSANRPVIQLRFESFTIRLRGEQMIFGRSSYCTAVLARSSVSRVHAAIDRVEEHVELRDLGSKNGTFVNGRRIGREPVRLQLDDILRFGDVGCVVETAAPSSARVDTTDRPSAPDIDLDQTATLRSFAASKGGDDG